MAAAVALWLTTVVLSILPASAWAQTEKPRSRTGRHRAEPAKVLDSSADPAAPNGRRESGWFVGLGAGMVTGGDLWRVETANGAAVPWRSSIPFRSSRFSATLSSNFGGGIFVGRRLSDRWSARLDLNSARMDVTAEALQGQQAAVFGYDRLMMTTVAVTGEAKLVRQPSAPFLGLGIVLNRISATRESDLDQTRIGFRIGGGYLKVLSPRLSLRGEARYGRTNFDIGSFLPQSSLAEQPELIFAPADDINLFELLLAVQVNL